MSRGQFQDSIPGPGLQVCPAAVGAAGQPLFGGVAALAGPGAPVVVHPFDDSVEQAEGGVLGAPDLGRGVSPLGRALARPSAATCTLAHPLQPPALNSLAWDIWFSLINNNLLMFRLPGFCCKTPYL